MKPSLTPTEKAENKQRNNLQALCNGIASAFNFKKVKTWHDVYRQAGQSEEYIVTNYEPAQLSKTLDFQELKSYFDKLKAQLEETIAEQRQKRELEEKKKDGPVVSAPLVLEDSKEDESGIHNDKDYGLEKSPNEVAFLFWFQKLAIKNLLDGILGRK